MASFLSILALLGMPVGAYLLSLCIRGATTGWAWAWMVAYVLVDLGCFWLVGNPRRARIMLALGLALTAALVGLRHSQSGSTAQGSALRLPAATPGSWVGRLGEEADIGPMMFTAFGDFGAYARDDVPRGRPYVRQAYRRMLGDPDFAPVPSTVTANILGLSSPSASETLVFNASPEAAGARVDRVVIFLHGAGPFFKLPCWMLSRRMPDALVVCPTVGLRGEWAHPDGAETFQAVLSWAHERSAAVYAVGWGAGAEGLLRLLNRNALGHVSGIALVSGYAESYFDDVRRSGIPVLILHGAQDNRTPAFRVEGLAGLDRVRNVEIEGDSFLFYEQEETVLEEIDSFCGAH